MHTKSNLYDVGKCVFGETATDQIEAWIQETVPLLFEGKISGLAAHIRAFETKGLEVMDRRRSQCHTGVKMYAQE